MVLILELAQCVVTARGLPDPQHDHDGGEGGDVLANRLRSQHHGIYDAIASGAGPLVADLIEAHIRSAYTSLPAMAESQTDRS